MRRYFMLYCLISLILAFSGIITSDPSTSIAQSTDPEWRYAFNLEAGQLVAYSLNGDVNVLLEAEGLLPQFRFMFADDNALIELEGAETRSYYRLTPQSAEPIPIDPEFDWFPVVKNDRYLVLHATHQLAHYAPNLLYDSQKGQVIELQGLSNWPTQELCCGFSADGQTLRYLSFASEESLAWTSIERSLETGEERVFFAPDVDFENAHPSAAFVETDSHGERWLWRYRDNATNRGSTNLVQTDGTNEVLETYEGFAETAHRLIGDYFAQRPASCDEGCLMTVQPSEGDSVSLQVNDLRLNDLIRLSETQFLTVGDDYWLLSIDESPILIGVRSLQYLSIDSILSPDGRWLTLVDDAASPSKAFIWDTATQTIAFEIPIHQDADFRIFSVVYSPTAQMFVILSDGQESIVGFEYATGESFSFPVVENERRRFFEILADGSVLFYRVDRDTLAQSGIWRYDPPTDEVSSILTGGAWLPITFRSVL